MCKINSFIEITSHLAPFLGYIIANYILNLNYPYNFLFTVLFSTISWIVVTLSTKPTESKTLEEFYRRVKPDGWWNLFKKEESKSNMKPLLICWISSIVMVYSCLFMIGDLIFKNYEDAILELIISFISFIILRKMMKKTQIFDN